MRATLRRGSASAAVGLGLCLGLLPAGQAQARTFVPCNDIPALKAAIVQANATAVGITLASGCTYVLTETDNGEDGLPEITGNVRINSTGATIERADTAPAFRIFHVLDSGSLTLNHITVSGGQTDGDGGGIRNQGNLTLNESTVSDNQALPYGWGGGIQNDYGNVSMNRSTVKDNKSSLGGGIWSGYTGTLTLNDTTFSGNEAQDGGAIRTWDTMRMQGGAFRDNTASSSGGGLSHMGGDTTVNAAFITGNSAYYGGGVSDDYFFGSQLRLNSTVISKNHATYGGGLANLYSTSTLVDSRVTGNTASDPGSGGGIYEAGGEVRLLSTTVTGNTPDNCAPPGSVPGCTSIMAGASGASTLLSPGMRPQMPDMPQAPDRPRSP